MSWDALNALNHARFKDSIDRRYCQSRYPGRDGGDIGLYKSKINCSCL